MTDVPIELGGSTLRINPSPNINYDQPQHPYAGGFIMEKDRFAQVMPAVDVVMGEEQPIGPTLVPRTTGSADIRPDGPAPVSRTNVQAAGTGRRTNRAGETGEASERDLWLADIEKYRA